MDAVAPPGDLQNNPSPAPEDPSFSPQTDAANKADLASPTSTTPSKPIHSLVVDTGPLINNTPPVSTLLAQAEEIWTIPSVLSEIRDEATRARVQTTLLPFLKLRSPKQESIKFITDFARKTGDLEVLSKPDIHLLSLSYELEVERNRGDWRLRKTPGQKSVNGKPPGREEESKTDIGTSAEEGKPEPDATAELVVEAGSSEESQDAQAGAEPTPETETVQSQIQDLRLDGNPAIPEDQETQDASPVEVAEDEDDDEGGWITPDNLKKHQAKDAQAEAPSQPVQRVLQAALLTADFAMQNVALRANLNLLSPSNLARITQVKSWVLRCHGCFHVLKSRKMNEQFCPRCGQPTLTRTSCSTDAAGNFRIHLKRNFQWNNRGNVYSIPKPTHGSASGKKANVQGGGKNGWGKDLILAGDQKEYVRKVEDDRRTRYHDLMDEDYLPNILSGERSGANGRIKVGAGRNVNSKKRK